MKYLAVLTFLLSVFAASPLIASNGTLSIVGKMNTSGCDIGVTGGALKSKCYFNGMWIHQAQPLSDLSSSNMLIHMLKTEVIWLDEQQKNGLVIINYH